MWPHSHPRAPSLRLPPGAQGQWTGHSPLEPQLHQLTSCIVAHGAATRATHDPHGLGGLSLGVVLPCTPLMSFKFLKVTTLAPQMQNFPCTRHFTHMLSLTPHILLDTFCRVRECKRLACGCPAGKWEKLDLGPGACSPRQGRSPPGAGESCLTPDGPPGVGGWGLGGGKVSSSSETQAAVEGRWRGV